MFVLQDSRAHSKFPSSPSTGTILIRSSSFGLVGSCNITQACLKRSSFDLEKVPTTSPLTGKLELKIICHNENLVEERGFLTIFDDVGGFGAWHRRWCLLSNDQLLFWKYPDDESKKVTFCICTLIKEHLSFFAVTNRIHFCASTCVLA